MHPYIQRTSCITSAGVAISHYGDNHEGILLPFGLNKKSGFFINLHICIVIPQN